MIRENGGWESFKMVVIKEYPCNTKIELQIEEEKCRKELQANLNDKRCHRTEEERTLCNNEYKKANKEKSKEYNKVYYEENKEKISKKKAESRKEKMTCACGSTFRCADKARHEKSEKHQSFINRAD